MLTCVLRSFKIEEDFGRARVYDQSGSTELIQKAIDSWWEWQNLCFIFCLTENLVIFVLVWSPVFGLPVRFVQPSWLHSLDFSCATFAPWGWNVQSRESKCIAFKKRVNVRLCCFSDNSDGMIMFLSYGPKSWPSHSTIPMPALALWASWRAVLFRAKKTRHLQRGKGCGGMCPSPQRPRPHQQQLNGLPLPSGTAAWAPPHFCMIIAISPCRPNGWRLFFF